MEKHGRARPATDDNMIRRMRIACRITKATDPHSEYEILIAFPRPQWLHERTSILRLCLHCVSCNVIVPSTQKPSKYSSFRISSRKFSVRFYSSQYVPHAPPVSHFLVFSPQSF
jgi:hypothetical protein